MQNWYPECKSSEWAKVVKDVKNIFKNVHSSVQIKREKKKQNANMYLIIRVHFSALPPNYPG